MAVQAVESWDDDLDLDGPLLTHSVSTQQTSVSSRLSVRADSVAAEEDWDIDLAPNDESSVLQAISHAKEAGIPLPSNVPSSALVGGTIKRIGNKQSRHHFKDDWGDELDFAESKEGGLNLKMTPRAPAAFADEEDGFSDWAEGSLGIRTAGTRNAMKNRDSTNSAFSPSMGSCITVESEEDGLDGLEIPIGPLIFGAALKKRPESEAKEEFDSDKTLTAALHRPVDAGFHQDDFFADMDFAADDVFDLKKKTLNRNVKQSWKVVRDGPQAPKTQATLVFTEKSASTRIPRAVPAPSRLSRLEPVLETATSHTSNARRTDSAPTSTHPLRTKRSSTGLNKQSQAATRQPVPSYMQPGNSHIHTQTSLSRFAHYNARRESDPARAQSPPLRPHSRLSHAFIPDTPTRQRRDVAPPTLAREAAAKRTLTRPSRRRNFGDGSELDTFDDLPTSAAKESKFTKQPVLRPTTTKTLRNQPSLTKLAPLRDRMTTPLPPSTPRSLARTENLPRFARDTAASRIAREQKLGPVNPIKNTRDIPLAPRTNWAAQIAARTPVTSPSTNRIRRGPQLVNPMGKENIRHFQEDAARKGMRWNPTQCRWEGNESALINFESVAAPPSPPRPALITNISSTKGVQVVGGMVFDPQRMCWLKMGQQAQSGHNADPRSPSMDDDDDPFRDIEDLADEKPQFERSGATGGAGRNSLGGHQNDWVVSEEFDLGPEFIRRQKEEEAVWRARTSAWFTIGRHAENETYKWAIRDIAATVGL